MMFVKADPEMWNRMNLAALNGEPEVNAAVLIVTMADACTQILIASGISSTEHQARAHLAAILLSPDDGDRVGSLLPLLARELKRIDDGGRA